MLQPISTVDLFPILDQKLIGLLQTLTDDDWLRPTVAPLWTVKDVAAHLLDGNIRGLSIGRDRFVGPPAPEMSSYADLVGFLNRLNADWTTAARRISPPLLTALIQATGEAYSRYLHTLAPFDEAVFPVAWAGEEKSRNWFHIAREYTEKWHHQQQIRLAVGRESELYATALYTPFLDTCMRALPHHYRQVAAPDGTVIRFEITNGLGTWFLMRTGKAWRLLPECNLPPATEIQIEHAVAWRIFMKGIAPETACRHVKTTGNAAFGKPILNMLAVMA